MSELEQTDYQRQVFFKRCPPEIGMISNSSFPVKAGYAEIAAGISVVSMEIYESRSREGREIRAVGNHTG